MAEVKTKISTEEFVPEFLSLAKFAIDPEKTYPHLMSAFSMAAKAVQELWRRYAQGAPIPPGMNVINSRGDYAKSIQIAEPGPFDKIIFSDYKNNAFIEEGHKDIDLKPGLLAGPKARMGKAGPYNIVSFRHGVPGTTVQNKPMPVNVYNLMQAAEKKADQQRSSTISQVTGHRSTATGNVRAYDWRARLPESLGGKKETKKISKPMQKELKQRYGRGPSKYTWKTGKYSGMVRMQQSTSGAKNTGYITFRVVSINSDPASWIVPARDGIPIRQAVISTLRPQLEQMFASAIEEDLKS